MEVQYFGANCIAISTKSGRIVVDDNLKDLGLNRVAKPNDILLYTSRQNIDESTYKLVIDCPGEYEVGDLTIYGIEAKAYRTEENNFSTIYKIIINELTAVVIGHIAPELSDTQIEEIGLVDILFIPVGGHDYTLDSASSLKLVREIAPKIVIPTHYSDSSIKYLVPQDSLIDVSKVFSMEPKEAGNKLKIKSSELTDTMQLVVLDRS
jgi:L-ascorbate metabolism protein UlaG (beta-lactamase superfamily)